MSRSGYSDDCDGSKLNLWRGAVNSAIKGTRGQAFIVEAIQALDAMPRKELIAESLQETASGEFCTLGVVGHARGLALAPLENLTARSIATAFSISHAMTAEIMYENDDEDGQYDDKTPEQRWIRMRKWLESNLTRGD